MAKENKIIIGRKYSRLTVDSFHHKDKRHGSYYSCRCDCGKVVVIYGSYVTLGRVKSCGCLRIESGKKLASLKKLPDGESSFRDLCRRYRREAHNRHLSFDLSMDEMRVLTSNTCAYCGVEPSAVYHKGRCSVDYLYNGVDRIDSSKGYMPTNVCSCCKRCNSAKNDMSVQEFLGWVKRVEQYQSQDLNKVSPIYGKETKK